MKVTKFPQSCILIEKDNQNIVIDPGVHFLQHHNIEDLKEVKAVLYTHQHPDHYDPKVADAMKAQGVPLYANEDTASLIGEGCTVVKDNQKFSVAGFDVTARELPHCLLPNNGPGPQNTGYVIDGAFFHPGDGYELAGLQVDNMALPITGPDISMLDAMNFADQLQAKVVIPIHYTAIPADPDVFAQFAGYGGRTFDIRVLANGESTDL
jgi:L-ascorbate metabolism protein UlaG (beta-lactamase superfamily)